MSNNNYRKHLTLSERKQIQFFIEQHYSLRQIGIELGKDPTTIKKEILNHRKVTKKSSYPMECKNFKTCTNGRICPCEDYEKFVCQRRDKSPGVCNKCPTRYCRYERIMYDAKLAQEEYQRNLVDCRTGINITAREFKAYSDIIVPLIAQGQSPYVVVTQNPQLGITTKTLYNWIEWGYFNEYGIDNTSLREKVSRRIPKSKKQAYKKRKDNSYIIGRTYEDFLKECNNCPKETKGIVEMDTVYNDKSGPYIQTFKFLSYGFLFAVIHQTKTSISMCDGINLLYEILGKKLFTENVRIIVTDRGTEFSNPHAMEVALDGSKRTSVFYCDPMQSQQKGSIEREHKTLRALVPKNKSFGEIRLNRQDDLNKILSHLNSYPREHLDGKSPFSYLKFMNESLYTAFVNYGIIEIPIESVTINSTLLTI